MYGRALKALDRSVGYGLEKGTCSIIWIGAQELR